MKKITAPFSADQVDALNQFQMGVSWRAPGHPVTCPQSACARSARSTNSTGSHTLVATAPGWVCPRCGYTRDWAHAFMAQDASQAFDGETSGCESVVCESLASYAMLAFRTRGRITDRQALLERIQAAIASYAPLYMSCISDERRSAQDNDLKSRVWSALPVMLASLSRRRMALMGVSVTAGKAPAADASWTRLSQRRPADDALVEVLMQDKKITNPFHDGYGCNAWIEARRFCSGRLMTCDGTPTHWRPFVRLSL